MTAENPHFENSINVIGFMLCAMSGGVVGFLIGLALR